MCLLVEGKGSESMVEVFVLLQVSRVVDRFHCRIRLLLFAGFIGLSIGGYIHSGTLVVE